MNEKVVKLFCEESKIVFADGHIYAGAVGVSDYLVRVIESSVKLGFKRGAATGFVGGIAVSGFCILTYQLYQAKK